tara:strand:+ start:653 stop:892 length:240 start_codon:yes stop_codon:yes gene_type:complete
MKENAIVIELLQDILKETIRLTQEVTRIRTKLDSEVYKIGSKYELIDNNILICKNKFKNSIRSYQPKISKNSPIVISFE